MSNLMIVLVIILMITVYIFIAIITVFLSALIESGVKNMTKPDFEGWVGHGIFWPIALPMSLLIGLSALIRYAPEWIYDKIKDKDATP